MLIAFGTSGDVGYLHELVARHGFIVGQSRDGLQVDCVVHRMASLGGTGWGVAMEGDVAEAGGGGAVGVEDEFPAPPMNCNKVMKGT
jgi:hypothetical protein